MRYFGHAQTIVSHCRRITRLFELNVVYFTRNDEEYGRRTTQTQDILIEERSGYFLQSRHQCSIAETLLMRLRTFNDAQCRPLHWLETCQRKNRHDEISRLDGPLYHASIRSIID